MAACEPGCTCGRHRKAAPAPTVASTPPVSVLVPWRDSGPDRAAAWEYVNKLWVDRHPDWQVLAGDYGDGPWCKALAVADAWGRADADILVVADADVWCDGVAEAVDAVRAGAAWAQPHYQVRRLSAPASAQVYESGQWPTQRTSITYAQRPYPGRPGGGMVVLTSDLYGRVPLDPRFTGWGQEDESWAIALNCVAGPRWRGTADLWHLWHPPQARQSRSAGNAAGVALLRRYQRAYRSPSRMASLLDEFR